MDDSADSYQRRAPSWYERVTFVGNRPGFVYPNVDRDYDTLSKEAYPKIYQALAEECAFRSIETPHCYIDTTGKTRLGCANRTHYCLIIDSRDEAMFTVKELRALMAHEIKHLYQDDKINPHVAEYDSDRAAIESTGYATVRSYVDKAITSMIDEKVPVAVFRSVLKKLHAAFPGMIAEHFYIPLDKYHPSPGHRMHAMWIAEQWKLQNAEGFTQER